MKCFYLACAESFSLDMQTNRLSMFHMLDALTVASVPFIITQASIACSILKEAGDANNADLLLRVKIQDAVVAEIGIELQFTDSSHVRNVTTINNLVIPILGNLRFELSQGRNELAVWETRVDRVGSHSAHVDTPEAVRHEAEIGNRSRRRKRTSM